MAGPSSFRGYVKLRGESTCVVKKVLGMPRGKKNIPRQINLPTLHHAALSGNHLSPLSTGEFGWLRFEPTL